LKVHVERRINEAEAAVIREIFEKAAAGWVPAESADLNARGIGAPLPRRTGRPRGWAPSTIYRDADSGCPSPKLHPVGKWLIDQL
jgi:hypothetical protein